MTNQTNSSSPFFDGANNNTQNLPNKTEGFSIHTMRDDLLSVQKGDLPTSTSAEVQSSQIAPTPSAANLPKNTTGEAFFQSLATKKPSGEEPVPPDSIAPIEEELPEEELPAKEDFFIPVEIPVARKSFLSSSLLYKITLGAIFFFLIAIIGLGGYYFFLKNRTIVETPLEAPVENPAETPIVTPVETPAVTIPVAEKYSSNMPNYLSFDPAKETLNNLNQTFASIASDLKNKNPGSIYEFSVVDSNNNPVMLPIFAAAAKFNLSSVILEKLGETFSIFFYNDNGVVRLALATTVKDKPLIIKEMLKQEATLISDAAFLFLETVPEKKPAKFGESSYNGFTVKYFNLVFNPQLSVDYIISDSSLVIGTSKNTARAVMDKLSTIANASTPTSTTPTSQTQTSSGIMTIKPVANSNKNVISYASCSAQDGQVQSAFTVCGGGSLGLVEGSVTNGQQDYCCKL